MSRLVLAVLALVAMVRPSAQGELSKELQSLQGTWVITTVDGKPVRATDPEMALVIEGNKYAQTIGGAVNERGEIRLDPSKTPMVMDLFIAEGKDANKAQFGVVRVEGAVLTMKLNAPAEPTRPKEFTVAAGYTVFVATRKTKA